ncbi:MAG: response regulator [Candidatus Obscuribacterales bacterium]|nr:response regulator [Candidatus Obscuribacterales bacterium]
MYALTKSSLDGRTQDPVLIVEDNLTNQKVATLLVARLGLQSQIANNGKEAVELYADTSNNFSVILMDCHMPEMDGFEASVAIRKMERLSGMYTPIIAVTALAMAGDRERCIAAGMDDYLPKPIDPERLRAKLNHWMRADVLYQQQKHHRRFLRPQSPLAVLEPDPINVQELEEFYGFEQLSEMLRVFQTDTSDMLVRLETFMDEKNARAVAGLAHELKAGSASIGAKQLAKVATLLEQAVVQEDWAEATELRESFKKSFHKFQSFVEANMAAEQATAETSS